MENKNSNAFDGMQNDEVMKEITCAIISGSFGVITSRNRTAIVSSSFTLIDVWNHLEQWRQA